MIQYRELAVSFLIGFGLAAPTKPNLILAQCANGTCTASIGNTSTLDNDTVSNHNGKFGFGTYGQPTMQIQFGCPPYCPSSACGYCVLSVSQQFKPGGGYQNYNGNTTTSNPGTLACTYHTDILYADYGPIPANTSWKLTLSFAPLMANNACPSNLSFYNNGLVYYYQNQVCGFPVGPFRSVHATPLRIHSL